MPGVPAARTLAAGETARYALFAEAGTVLLVEIDQGGLDVGVVHQPSDGPAVTVNSLLGRAEREVLLLEQSPAGRHVIELSSEEFTDRTAQLEVRVTVLDPVEQASEVAAYRAMMIGGSHAGYLDEEGLHKAHAAYSEAASIWRQAGDLRGEAWALLNIARIEYERYDWEAAAITAEKAATAYDAVGDQPLFALATFWQAAALIEAGTKAIQGKSGEGATTIFAKADSLYEEALRIQKRAGRAFDQAVTLNDLGLSALYQGRVDMAVDRWSEAADMFRDQTEWGRELQSRANLGVALYETGRLRESVATFTRVLDLLPTDRQPELHATTLDNRAQAQAYLDDHDQALADFAAALAVHEQRGSIKGRGRSLSGIASVYHSLGDLERAREYYDRSLILRTQANDGRGRVSTARSLGDVERQLGNLERAEQLHRTSLALSLNPREQAQANVALARDMRSAHRAAESLAPLEDAIRLAVGIGLERVIASALLERGHAWIEIGDMERATRDLDEAMAIYVRLGLLNGQASALYMLATIAATEERWQAALHLARESIDRVEALRGRVPFSELRATYLSQRRAPYELYVDIMMSLAGQTPGQLDPAYVSRALGAAELARSRAFVDLISEAALDKNVGSDPELLDRQQDLYQRLSETRYRRDRALEMAHGDGLAVRSEYLDEMNRIETELQVVEAELRRTSERYAALTAPETLDATEIMALLEEDELLVQFSLGTRRSFLWFVDRNAIRARVLPGRAAIESMARSVYEDLRVYLPDRESRRARDAQLQELADTLFGDFSGLSDYTRVLVAADGVLQYVPFAVLPVSTTDGRRQPLIASQEVVGVASMSALALNRQIASPAGTSDRLLAIFADPVFRADDPRLSTGASAFDGSVANGDATADTGWARLTYTSLEAERIERMAPAEQTFKAIGPAANRETAMDPHLGGYRYVHFATHARIDTRYPALSGLALSSVDAAGRPTDGRLEVPDISRLTLNAELVVLSACDTALGREIRGESLLGLSQAFFAAGADQVVASLWPVPDRGTATLMEELYDGLLRQGLSPAAALRRAQLAVAEQRRWADPYYWAGFVLQRGR